MPWSIKVKLITLGLAAFSGIAVQVMMFMTVQHRASEMLAEMSLGSGSEQGSPRQPLTNLVEHSKNLAVLRGDGPDAAALTREIEFSLRSLRETLDKASDSAGKRDHKEAILAASKLLLDLERSILLDLPRLISTDSDPNELAFLQDRIAEQVADFKAALDRVQPRLLSGQNLTADEVIAELEQAASTSLTAFTMSLIIIGMIVIFFGLSITRPMALLTLAMQKLAKGEPDVAIDTTRMDEVGAMARALQAVKERMVELESRR